MPLPNHYQFRVFRPDGTRFEAHHCDGQYPVAGHDQGLQDVIWEALRDPEVGEFRIIKPKVDYLPDKKSVRP